MSTKNKKILICIDWYEPGFKAGGPIRSVSNMVAALKNDFDFYILTSAYDLGSSEPYEGIQLDTWYDQEGIFIKYLTRPSLKPSNIRNNILEIEPDILYLNSLFSRLFTLVPLNTVKRKKITTILAPRGMLGGNSLAIKAKKKRVFLTLSRLTRFYNRTIWHASTENEAKDIRSAFGKKANIVVTKNIPLTQKLELENILDRKNTGIVRFVYISRIVPIKNLHLALEALRHVSSKQKLEFAIYGNIEDQDYFESFKDQIKQHENINITYNGVLLPVDIADAYANADFLLLPTAHENYGHAIVEAWANGCPVIISKNTPWRNLKISNIGWDVDLGDIRNLSGAIQEAIDQDFTSYIQMVRSCYEFFANNIGTQDLIDDNRKLFEDAS
ncbi:MAG: glycosyltransferase [Crocinitomicaceae bacterium]|nr:glycosyltransferase [Crocinitomicaceae bacterium]